MFKPNLIFVFILLSASWLINRQFRKMILVYAGFAIAASTAVIFSSIYFGSMRCWVDWLRSGVYIPLGIAKVEMGNYSLSRLVIDRFGMDFTPYLMVIFAAAAILSIWLSRRRALNHAKLNAESYFPEDTPVAAAGSLVYLLSAPLVWLHYYILAIPGLIWVLRQGRCSNSKADKLSLISSLGPALLVIMLFLNPCQASSWLNEPRYAAISIIMGTFILFLLLLQKISGLDNLKGPVL
jgi:hypothetical protein